MGHVFDFTEAKSYERWFNSPRNKLAFELETQLMKDLLQPMRGESVLDIGCGTGACLSALHEMGLQVTGLDPSTYMLDMALEKMGNRAELYRGFAEDLPFDDNSFNYSCLFTTLEFVNDPAQALREAFRVTKDRVFIGVFNRYAIKGIQRRVKGIFSPTIFNHAQFFSVWELKQMIRTIIGRLSDRCPFPGVPFASCRYHRASWSPIWSIPRLFSAVRLVPLPGWWSSWCPDSRPVRWPLRIRRRIPRVPQRVDPDRLAG